MNPHAFGLLAVLGFAATTLAQQPDRDPIRAKHYAAVLEHIEKAIGGLAELGHDELAGKLKHFYKEAAARKTKGQPQDGGDDSAGSELKILRLAMSALAKTGRQDAAELVEMAVHARELKAAGRVDEKARRIQEHAPGRPALGKLLFEASRLLHDEFEKPAEAGAVKKLAQAYLKATDANANSQAGQRAARKPVDKEHRNATHQLESLVFGSEVLAKVGNREGAGALKKAAQAMKLRLARRDDEEARAIQRAAPGRGDVAELLTLAADHAAEWGKHDDARALLAVARQFAPKRQGSDQRRDAPRDEVLQRQLATMRKQIDEMAASIRELQQEIRQGRNELR